jgi:hypothetical protein
VSRRDSAVVISTSAIRRVFIVVLLIVALALVALFGRQLLQRPAGVAEQIDKNAYQAVFLTGGQVFFGHATAGDDSIALTDVFYLAPSSDAAQPQQLGSLIKRGSELHGPREPMIIETRQVLFIENLRDDSQVVAAIKRFKSGEPPAATAAPQPPATTQPPAAPTGTPRPSASR